MSFIQNGIPPEKFYGKKTAVQEKIEAILENEQTSEKLSTPKFLTRLLGPSLTWKVFKKQDDAINFCHRRRNGLMSFAFEDVNARRMFLVAHPKVFWAFNCHRFFKNCNTYEIIQEHSTCKLYLDIEYEYAYNGEKNGDRMLNNFLDIINLNLKEYFNVSCLRTDILDLDSSSKAKYSHHVIYEIKNKAFQDNYTVGNFIKKICSELRVAYDYNLSGDTSKLKELADKYSKTGSDILELFINDRKNQIKLFVDEGVYTKNRHFRTLGSSKLTKNIPLEISKSNKYKPIESSDIPDCCLFLDSLVTYFSWEVERVLEFEGAGKTNKLNQLRDLKPKKESDKTEFSLYSQIDSFIDRLISPRGKIRRKVYFSDSSIIVYDIQGFRYCDNIKREHRSNNIKFIVDLQSLVFYQKCHDPDCEHFRSDAKRLPEEICFLFEDDSFFDNEPPEFNFSDFSDDIFIDALERTNNEDSFDQSISDEDLGKVFDCTEALLNVNW